MKERPPTPLPELDSTRESRGLADVVNARVRAATGAKEVERSSRSGEARQAALRLSALVVTPDNELEAFRFTRKLRIAHADLARARTILDRVNEALLADASTAQDILDRLTNGLTSHADAATSSGRPGSTRTSSTRIPSVEVVTAPPVAPEQAWSALGSEAAPGPAAVVQASAAQRRPPRQGEMAAQGAPGKWAASIAEEETALGAASSGGAVTRLYRPGEAGTAAAVPRGASPGPSVVLTIEQHAALAAECDTYPHYRAQIEQRYGIAGGASRDAVDQWWNQRLQADEALWSRWHELYAAYRESFS